MISIREVAKLAGVSPSTVSRVMNGTANVNDEKRQKVERVIKETGFKPNEAARTLYKKSAHVIGIIVPNIENPFFNAMARAIEQEAYKNGYRLMLCNSSNNLEKEKNSIELLGRMNADGIILLTNQEGLSQDIRQCRIPVIAIDRQVKNSDEVVCIESDHYKGGRIAMEHLIQCGCRHIVNMQAPKELSSARQRYQGYLDVCREQGIEPCSVQCKYAFEDGMKQTELLLEKYPETDGILAANDMVAISAYKVLHKKGLRVPQDVQVIGFDNINLSSLMTPEITTVAQPIQEMGAAAVRILLDYLDGKAVEKRNIFDVELIIRETTSVLSH